MTVYDHVDVRRTTEHQMNSCSCRSPYSLWSRHIDDLLIYLFTLSKIIFVQRSSYICVLSVKVTSHTHTFIFISCVYFLRVRVLVSTLCSGRQPSLLYLSPLLSITHGRHTVCFMVPKQCKLKELDTSSIIIEVKCLFLCSKELPLFIHRLCPKILDTD